MNTRQSLLLLPASIALQWARYLYDIQDLTLEGSAEPRRWIGCAERFWIGVASATGDCLLALSGTPAPPAQTCADPPTPTILPAGQRTLEITVEVPPSAFDLLACERLSLRPSALQRGDDVVLIPGRHLVFPRPLVSRDSRFAELRLFDLPALRPGMELHGVIWAERDAADSAATPGAAAASVLPVAPLWIRVS